jgi:hypothetical protein
VHRGEKYGFQRGVGSHDNTVRLEYNVNETTNTISGDFVTLPSKIHGVHSSVVILHASSCFPDVADETRVAGSVSLSRWLLLFSFASFLSTDILLFVSIFLRSSSSETKY